MTNIGLLKAPGWVTNALEFFLPQDCDAAAILNASGLWTAIQTWDASPAGKAKPFCGGSLKQCKYQVAAYLANLNQESLRAFAPLSHPGGQGYFNPNYGINEIKCNHAVGRCEGSAFTVPTKQAYCTSQNVFRKENFCTQSSCCSWTAYSAEEKKRTGHKGVCSASTKQEGVCTDIQDATVCPDSFVQDPVMCVTSNSNYTYYWGRGPIQATCRAGTATATTGSSNPDFCPAYSDLNLYFMDYLLSQGWDENTIEKEPWRVGMVCVGCRHATLVCAHTCTMS